ncbi:MAG: NAD(P)H-binding protein [Gemmatimonadaceae bacterium]
MTTPTGQIGKQLLDRLCMHHEPIRVIARDPNRLDSGVRNRVEVVPGSLDDPAVLGAALDGADGLFWLVPPGVGGSSTGERYLAFTRPAADAIRRYAVPHVVGVSSAGHGWPTPAGVLSAAFAMDAEIERTGAAYRALSMPFYMENLLQQVGSLREHGSFALAHPPEQTLACVATRDIAGTAAALLTDRSWSGQEDLPVFGPDRLSPDGMASVMSEVLGRTILYKQVSVADVEAGLTRRGAGAGIVRDVIETTIAVQEGIYDRDQERADPCPTDFRTWCREVLLPVYAG